MKVVQQLMNKRGVSQDALFLHPSLDQLDNILVKMIHQVRKVSLVRVRAEAFSSNPVHIVFPGKITKIFHFLVITFTHS